MNSGSTLAAGSWRSEAGLLARLAAPIVLTQLAMFMLNVVDLLLVGRVGTDALNAVALGNVWKVGTLLLAMGLVFGADPVAMSMLHAAGQQGRVLDAFVVRKAEKTHGLQRRIEGPDVKGRRVLAVEDTSTTGASVLAAVAALAEAGAEVVGVAVLADRGARSAVTGRGLIYRAAYELADLGV